MAYCSECETDRPSEAFSGKGRKQRVCKRCIQHRGYRNEIRVWLKGPQLSNGQMKQLRRYMHMSNESTAALAALVIRIGEIAPEKANRAEILQNEHPNLWSEADAAGLTELLENSGNPLLK